MHGQFGGRGAATLEKAPEISCTGREPSIEGFLLALFLKIENSVNTLQIPEVFCTCSPSACAEFSGQDVVLKKLEKSFWEVIGLGKLCK